MKKIVIGTCWFRESLETLLSFIRNIIKSSLADNYDLQVVVFNARKELDDNSIKAIHDELEDCIILKHYTNIYPNKNFGVAAISKYADSIDADFISVIDSDWCNDLNSNFLTILFSSLIEGIADLVIPDNGNIVGRSNLLIGKGAIDVFYKDYCFIKTPFPGYFAGCCDLVTKITSSISYHFDWGGEWDLIKIAIENNARIMSCPIPVNWTAHRTNSSKVYDAFQIWRAIIQGISSERFKHLFTKNYVCDNTLLLKYLKPFKNPPMGLDEVMVAYNSISFDKTEEQMLFMVIYPVLALILEDYAKLQFAKNTDSPYEFDKLREISALVPPCLAYIFKAYDARIEQLKKSAENVCGGYWSKWDRTNQKKALQQFVIV